MSILKVALLQVAAAEDDQPANRARGEAACREAAALGADIALFPEMWNLGYSGFDPAQPGARDAWTARAIALDDPFVAHFRGLAAELDMAIALTFLERWPGGPRNTVALIDRHGAIRMVYAKVHTCDFEPSSEAALTPGDAFRVCKLDTAAGAVTVGAMICFDREFPESARVLMLQGAEIILTPNACDLEINRLAQFRARAYENMVGVAMANYPAPANNGHSIAFDGIAFDRDERSRDMCLVEAGEDEAIVVAAFDLDALRDYRQREVWGNAYRKPGRYALLAAPEVNPPFVRPDARR